MKIATALLTSALFTTAVSAEAINTLPRPGCTSIPRRTQFATVNQWN